MVSSPISMDTYDPHKKISPEDREARHRKVLMEGAKAAAIAGPTGLVASLLAQRNIRFYQRLSLPFKTFIALMIPTAAFFTVTDRAAMRADLEYAMRFSVTKKEDFAKPVDEADGNRSLSQLIQKYRYQIVGYGWAGTLGATLLYNWRRTDITRAVKIINARMMAQTFALAGVAGIAALAATATPVKEIDPHYNRIVNSQ
ncbi:uncharacterized protein SPPG_01563 [Spizellomyces punctatus DAOM BR117]|uniref:HIG1 domain-containing protein n=1 Tax=Spizellomyces punctatus (strain DAOM BR117) TaxID=645134 RepID=A0A0L0HTA2_SPIPD|nr:uncharacterized protein SPPG_01563 [Spizellomyces punctatus DAOM BR117]KND04125.1 hypothetical protein SPPG_01563 [Spizellomyces punctatus DAOM BR117]|eukprot:XP_016612164.1 hypothetical protein SPPG_01563 [Spizellomyces punctatus DAOM BR117]